MATLRDALADLADNANEMWQDFVESMPAVDVAPEVHRRYHAHQAKVAAIKHARQIQRERREMALDAVRHARMLARGLPKTYLHPHNKIRYSLEDRWAIFGVTGSGKTVLAEQLVATLRRMYPQAGINILDSKGDKSFNRDADVIEQSDPPAPAAPGERLVWRPPTNDHDAYDAWCESLLRSDWPAVVHIDELASLGGTTGGASFPFNYHLLLKQGRDREKCLISLTQEAAYIPRNTLGQSTHLIRMHLILKTDAMRLDEVIHGVSNQRQEPEHPYGFYYKHLARPSAPIYFRDWRDMLGM